jgi:putative hydrolase of the HAD superfamily
MNPNIKVILFDLYGTLLVFDDFEKANRVWVTTFYEFASKRFGMDFETVQLICKNILESCAEKDLSGIYTTYETKIRKEFDKQGIVFFDEEMRLIADTSLEAWQKFIHPADDALSVLKEISKKKKIGLITNFDHSRHVKKVLTITGLDECFDFVLISDEARCIKPDRKIFQIAINHFGIEPAEAIYLGDNIIDDVKGSLDAGMKPVLISRNSKSNQHDVYNANAQNSESQNFTVIKSLSELISM